MARVCLRFAPSPTGFLHIGGLRTALFNWLFARKNKGKFILRIEDTDKERYVEGAVDNIIEALKWYGLDFDAGPIFQSKRIDIYKKHAEQLVEQGKAYYCFCSQKRLDEVRKIQQANRQATKYDGLCRKLEPSEVKKKIEAGEPSVIRLKVPVEGVTAFDVITYAHISVNNTELEDQILLKSDGYPTYHLANVVDDHEEGITHVVRAEEWLPSTPKHILLYKAFNWSPPYFAHLPMVLGTDRAKLSKRHGAVAALEYKNLGYLPEAVLNFIALLGWNPKTEKEIFTREELIKEFDLAKVNKASAIFNIEKLDWLNGQYIKKMKIDDFITTVTSFIEVKPEDQEVFKKLIVLFQDRMKRFTDITDLVLPYMEAEPVYDPILLVPKGVTKEETIRVLKLILEKLKVIGLKEYLKKESLKPIFEEFIRKNKLSNKVVLWPLRVAISGGQEKSLGVFELMETYGKSTVIDKVEKALEKLKKK